jgi:hypothetical protein
MSVSRELVEAIKIMTDREKNGKHTPKWWEDMTENQIIGISQRPADTAFVNVYALTRDFGGPEEGGWYYDSGEAVLSIRTTIEHAESLRECLMVEFPNYGNRYSVIYYTKPQDHSVDVQAYPAEDWSDWNPWE